MSRLLRTRWFVLLLVSVILITSCAPAATPTPAPTAIPATVAPAATKAPVAEPTKPAAPATVAPTAAAPIATVAPSPVPTIVAGTLKNVPRNRTLVSQGWDLYNQVPSPTNFNPYIGVLQHQRNILHYTVNESLFYTNFFTGEIIPWQGKSFEYNADFTEVTIKLRDGVKWNDGQPFTADDVAFTFDMLIKNAPDMTMSSSLKEWVKSAVVVDPLTVKVTLNKPGPRWAIENLAIGQTTRFVVMPKHIWGTVADPKKFEFFDMAKGWPVGTGPYKLVKTGPDSMFFDRVDKWWAVDTKLVAKLPEIERIIYAPVAADALANLYTSGDLDVGYFLELGKYEAAKARNPNLIGWTDEAGKAPGAPNGCVYRLTFNNQKAPYDDPDVRWAINYAINRDQIVQLAYEGSVTKNVAPFSDGDAVQKYLKPLKDLFDKYKPDTFDIKKTAELLTKKGYKKDAAGLWTKLDGSKWQINIISLQGNPAAPVLVQQLKAAGFDAKFETPAAAAFNSMVTSGDFETHLWVECGSLYDPWQTLDHFNSKYSAPAGKPITNVRAYTRYANPEMDKFLDAMEKMNPSADNPEYMKLVRGAVEIYLRDMPQIVFGSEYQISPKNTTYWTGYPTAKDPYIHPVIPWEGFNFIIHRLKAVK